MTLASLPGKGRQLACGGRKALAGGAIRRHCRRKRSTAQRRVPLAPAGAVEHVVVIRIVGRAIRVRIRAPVGWVAVFRPFGNLATCSLTTTAQKPAAAAGRAAAALGSDCWLPMFHDDFRSSGHDSAPWTATEERINFFNLGGMILRAQGPTSRQESVFFRGQSCTEMAAAAGADRTELSGHGTQARASSVLNGQKREYGPSKAVDGDSSTCWNSDQGLPQWLELVLANDEEPLRQVEALQITFQGGFSGIEMEVSASQSATKKGGALIPLGRVSPVDSSEPQSFEVRDVASGLEEEIAAAAASAGVLNRDLGAFFCRRIRLTFLRSSDFYGRVTVYGVECLGRVVESDAC
jgi:hypothetical protein